MRYVAPWGAKMVKRLGLLVLGALGALMGVLLHSNLNFLVEHLSLHLPASPILN